MLAPVHWFPVARRALAAYRADGLGVLAGALAFAAFGSLFPLLLLLVALSSLVLPAAAAEAWVLTVLRQVAPGGLDTQFIADVLRDVLAARGAGTGLAAALSLLTLGFTASGVFNTLYTAFNRIGGQPHSGHLIRDRLVALLVLLGAVPVLVLATVVSALLHALEARTTAVLGALPLVWQGGTLLVTLGLLAAVFALLFRALPRWAVTWADVWPAALLTAVLWEALRQGFAFYLGHFGEFDALFGALGGLIAVQTWIFLSAQVLLYGGEFAVAYAAARVRAALPLPAAPA